MYIHTHAHTGIREKRGERERETYSFSDPLRNMENCSKLVMVQVTQYFDLKTQSKHNLVSPGKKRANNSYKKIRHHSIITLILM